MPPKRKTPKKNELLFLQKHPCIPQIITDKIYGCIIGSALGDTIGLYTEFLTKAESARTYPNRKFQLIDPTIELHPDSHRSEHFQLDEIDSFDSPRSATRAWTDDTDQALLIVLAYLHNYTHARAGTSEGRTLDPTAHANAQLASDFAVRLEIWIDQGLLALNRHMCGLGALVGQVVGSDEYLEDPKVAAAEAWVASDHFAAPNGSLMRTHPIGVIGVGISKRETWDLAASVGFTTHADPRCTVSCCVEVALIRGLLRGEIVDEDDVDRCCERTYAYVKGHREYRNPAEEAGLTEEELESRLDRDEFEEHVYAETLEDLKLDEKGKIGYVYKCLGSAVLLLHLAMRRNTALAADGPLLVASIFEDLTVDLIMEGGDADTNAAVACALVGAYLGYSYLPSHWTTGLAYKEWLNKKTYRLAVATGVLPGNIGPEDDEAAEGPNGLMEPGQVRKRDARIHAQAKENKANAKARQKAVKKRKVDKD